MSKIEKENWGKVKLGDYITVLTDYHANGSYEKLKQNVHLLDLVEYAIMIRTTNFEKGDFEQDLKYITKPAYKFLQKSKVKPGDILMNRIANAGSVYYMPDLGRPVSLGMNLFLIRTREDKTNQKYIYYLKQNESYIKQFAIGTAATTITKDAVRNLDLVLPPVQIQNKIVSILSAYDDLIENNTRRIKILEEMVQTIYREWFVKFSFPGHEKVKMVESPLGMIPEGWEVTRVRDVADINKLSVTKNNDYNEIHYIDISSVSTGQVDSIEITLFKEAPSRARRIVKHGDIIWSTVRPNRKSYALILNPAQNLIVSTGFAVITARSIPYSYLYLALIQEDFVNYLTNHTTGAAYPAVNSDVFENAKIIVPPLRLLKKFDDGVRIMLEQKEVLYQKNINLKLTRDLILPRLITGEVDIK